MRMGLGMVRLLWHEFHALVFVKADYVALAA
jgi:hypothetical protein